MKSKKNKGLTLIEIVVSLAILGIIITPILSMTLTTVKISQSSEDKMIATNLAQQCTEYMKSEDISEIDFPAMLESQLGFKKLSVASTSDNENLDKIKSMLNGDPEIQDYYLYTGENKQKYKNIITKITYNIHRETPVNEDSDNSSYDMIITVDDNDEIIIVDTRNNEIGSSGDNSFNSNGSSMIEIINTLSDIECKVKQGSVDLISPVKVVKKSNDVGNVKFIFKSRNEINVVIDAKNTEAVNKKLDLKILKTSDSKYDCAIIENSGANSDNIIEKYQIFDVAYEDPNKLIKNYLVDIEVWYYDSKSNTKALMQQVKTYKTL